MLRTKPAQDITTEMPQRLYSDEGMLDHLILVSTTQSPHRLARGYESLRQRCADCACAVLTTPLFVPYVSKLLLCLRRCLVPAWVCSAVVAQLVNFLQSLQSIKVSWGVHLSRIQDRRVFLLISKRASVCSVPSGVKTVIVRKHRPYKTLE